MGIEYKTTVEVSFSGTPEEVLPELEKAVQELRARVEGYIMVRALRVQCLRSNRAGNPRDATPKVWTVSGSGNQGKARTPCGGSW